jgi:very-short-patch-repair endonuclease
MASKAEGKQRARELRRLQTEAEGLLWSLLRARQVCGLKFRRQHPIGPFFADFACVSHRIVVELDGGYHDQTQADDRQRQNYLHSHGWKVVRFSNGDVLQDAEVVARAIAHELGLSYTFTGRTSRGSGMMSRDAAKRGTKGVETRATDSRRDDE